MTASSVGASGVFQGASSVDGLDQLVETTLGLEQVGHGQGAQRRGVAGVALDLRPRELDDAVALVVAGVPLEAELVDEGVDVVLGRTHPLAADLDGDPRDRVVQRPATDPVPGLEHDDRPSGLLHPPPGGEPRDPCPDDDDVDVLGRCVRHAPTVARTAGWPRSRRSPRRAGG